MKIYFFLGSALFFTTLYAQQPDNSMSLISETADYPSLIPRHFQQSANDNLPLNGGINEDLNNKPLRRTGKKNGRLHGNWQSWYQNSITSDSGRLIKGVPDGIWKYWDENGQLSAFRTYSADKYQRVNNEMLRYHPKRITYPLAALYQVHRHKALKYLSMSYSFPAAGNKSASSSITELITANTTTGNLYKPVFDHCLHHGLFMNFYPGGIVIDSGYYKNGLRQGIWVHRDIEKRITERGTYNNGIKVKEWRVYNTSGKLEELAIYTSTGKIKKRKNFK